MHPFDDGGNPVPEAFGDDPSTARSVVAYNTFNESHGPIRQPETGAGVWIVVLMSTLCLWWMTKGMFAKTSS